ncbi:MAG: DegT/DnrJ/EryC1/StrS family aminotransferase [Candidatus Rokubacteria bacterium]|nr:DegT/DnrJ/EryC1/StrS family aminotransferase [Candidatus Rokubacteria bacterium]
MTPPLRLYLSPPPAPTSRPSSRRSGATPVFVDSEPRIRRGTRPKAVIVVHLYGQPADMHPIVEICARHEVPLIEDAAESLGATHKGRHAGTMGRFGGMLLGQSAEGIGQVRALATQAREPAPHYEHTHIGHNYRLSNIAAAIGHGQLTAIEDRLARRRAIFDHYVKRLGSLPGIAFVPEPAWGRGNCWLTCLTVDPAVARFDRETLRLALERDNIESRPLSMPMHFEPVFKDSPAYVGGVFEPLFARGLCTCPLALPLGRGRG